MGLTDEAKGKAKEFEGKATGDDKREAEGKLEQAKGEVKDAAKHVRDAAGNLADRARDEAEAQRTPRSATSTFDPPPCIVADDCPAILYPGGRRVRAAPQAAVRRSVARGFEVTRTGR